MNSFVNHALKYYACANITGSLGFSVQASSCLTMHSHSDLKALFLKIKSSVIDMYTFRIGKHVPSLFLILASKHPKQQQIKVRDSDKSKKFREGRL